MPRFPGRLAAALALSAAPLGAADFHDWAQTPPMGWNSWDCFATTVTDAKTREEADVMARVLRPHGWEYIVVDIQWYEPGSTGFGYRANAALALDGNGRLLPAENKFPSSAGNAGFRPLADYIHGKGLKFGIHLMRGIPRQAVERNLPISGSSHRASEIADTINVCPWNSDMYGIDMSKPGAQAYYDSVFELIASWGVDFVKMDDLARPYLRNEPEIEAVRRAIDRTGRPIVLSISPGETDIRAAAHVDLHANMWRISDDFWDHWSLLEAQFDRLNRWNVWRKPGAWPDADMLPIGTIDLGRQTWFSRDEEVTLMTLWSIARSPLMVGADLTKLDPQTLSLLTNDEVLAVNQRSSGNRQLFRTPDGAVGWIADAPKGRGKYVALFNTRDPWVLTDARRILPAEVISRDTPGQQRTFEVSVKGLNTVVLVAGDGGSPRFWWPSIFRQIRWGFADGREAPADREYGSHGEKVNGLRVPEGAVLLRGIARLDDAARENRKGERTEFSIYGYTASDLAKTRTTVPLAVATLGLGPTVRIRDLWAHADLGGYTTRFEPQIEWHGARLYLISSTLP
jgi:alpha-galactosidase